MSNIFIPNGQLADDAALAAKRAELKRRLLEGSKISLKKDGGTTGGVGEESSISIPTGKLAESVSDAEKRARLKKALLEGRKITAKSTGKINENPNEDASICIPTGKLAAQWYEEDPELLEMEKAAMAQAFDGFELGKLDDGRLFWVGDVTPGIYETKFGTNNSQTYTLMAVYQNNHPHQQMGSSVFVYPMMPNIEDLIKKCGFQPSHLLRDPNGKIYLCTAEADNVKAGQTITTAASVLAWAIKWLAAYELVLTGDMSKDDFNKHHHL